MTHALVFPGQGSQFVGMGAEFLTHPKTHAIFTEAEATLGFDIGHLMQEGPAESLHATQNTQVALLTHSYAAWHYFAEQSGWQFGTQIAAVAGHSVGEYTAACVAGAISFADALQLVRARGEAMATAVPSGQGGMAAIVGLPIADVDSTCRSTGCFIANHNAPDQYVISGSIYTIDEASNILVMQDAKLVKRLEVSGPFHTEYMAPAADAVAQLLATITIHPPQVPLVMNVDGQATTDPAHIRANLIAQITQPVRWDVCMATLSAHDVRHLLELGAGKVLCGLAKRQPHIIPGTPLATPEDIATFLETNGS